MYKDGRYYNAGENILHRWGKKAQAKLLACKEAENGFYTIPADGGNYWTLGTSNGKFGEFAKWGQTFFSVNSIGNIWAKAGTEKGEAFLRMIDGLVASMRGYDPRECSEDDE